MHYQACMSSYSSLMQEKGFSNTETYFLSFLVLVVLESYLFFTLVYLQYFNVLNLYLPAIYSDKFHNLSCGSKRLAPPALC